MSYDISYEFVLTCNQVHSSNSAPDIIGSRV
ncbi:MAG: hypothetical protein RLZZ385_2740 [Pseudomonadota bacterium]|jgi:hypothetical protein